MTASPVPPLTLDALRTQAGPAYARFSADVQARHLDLVARVSATEAVALDARPGDEAGTWVLAVATADHVGALSLIAGALAAAGLDTPPTCSPCACRHRRDRGVRPPPAGTRRRRR